MKRTDIGILQMRHHLKMQLMGLPDDMELTDEQIFKGVTHNENSITMISYARLTNIAQLVRRVVLDEIEGNVIETGVWRGGACIFMSKLLTYFASDKKVYVADSFEGLPAPTYKQDEGDYHHTIDFLSVDLGTVKANFERFKCEQNYEFVKGWFKDTLHLIDDKFSIIRLDGDMYESTIQALDALYPKLSIGGYCIIDDYGEVNSCKEAVEDYRNSNNITDTLIKIDNTGIYWQKIK